jgi:hypothetical protein
MSTPANTDDIAIELADDPLDKLNDANNAGTRGSNASFSAAPLGVSNLTSAKRSSILPDFNSVDILPTAETKTDTAATPTANKSTSSPRSNAVERSKKKVSLPSSISETLAATLSVHDIINNKRRYPLNAAEFQKYLQSQLVGEMYDFLIRVRDYRKISSDESLLSAAQEIVHEFIKENSSNQINISDPMRSAIEKQVAEANTILLPRVFDGAEKEILHLLNVGSFVRTFVKKASYNIDDREISTRKVISIVAFILTIIFIIILIFTVHVRWWRILSFPLFLWSMGAGFSASAGVCFVLVAKGVRQNVHESGRTTWIQAVKSKVSAAIDSMSNDSSGQCSLKDASNILAVQDESIKEILAQVAKAISLKAGIASVVCTIVATAIPSWA